MHHYNPSQFFRGLRAGDGAASYRGLRRLAHFTPASGLRAAMRCIAAARGFASVLPRIRRLTAVTVPLSGPSSPASQRALTGPCSQGGMCRVPASLGTRLVLSIRGRTRNRLPIRGRPRGSALPLDSRGRATRHFAAWLADSTSSDRPPHPGGSHRVAVETTLGPIAASCFGDLSALPAVQRAPRRRAAAPHRSRAAGRPDRTAPERPTVGGSVGDRTAPRSDGLAAGSASGLLRVAIPVTYCRCRRGRFRARGRQQRPIADLCPRRSGAPRAVQRTGGRVLRPSYVPTPPHRAGPRRVGRTGFAPPRSGVTRTPRPGDRHVQIEAGL